MDYPAIEDDGLITEMRSRRMRSATPAAIHKGSGLPSKTERRGAGCAMLDPRHPEPEPAGGAEPAREIAGCAGRTLAAPSARIELRRELRFLQAEWPSQRCQTAD
jgi:hypothetical protein